VARLRPGVWFPAQYRTICYDRVKPLAPNVRVPQWTDRIFVKDVSLGPDFPVDYFRDVPFPVGTPVEEIADDQVVRRYTQGAP
jgi:hypothetical protein